MNLDHLLNIDSLTLGSLNLKPLTMHPLNLNKHISDKHIMLFNSMYVIDILLLVPG